MCGADRAPGAAMNSVLGYIKELVKKGGPDSTDYVQLNSWLQEVVDLMRAGVLTKTDIQHCLESMGEAASEKTLQGFVGKRPHGYAGDFEIIDKIYTKHVSSNHELRKWDEYFHSHLATEAVRNRVQYFADQVVAAAGRVHQRRVRVLNVASGPGRDMLGFFKAYPELRDSVLFDCVEQDAKAINHARTLCGEYLESVRFIQKNALRFYSDEKYDLIWSAGLFDYLDERFFVFLLTKFNKLLQSGGMAVVGNFCPTNPSKAYMQLFEWNLHHRSPYTLRLLGMSAGFKDDEIEIRREKTGVNLFLHLNKS